MTGPWILPPDTQFVNYLAPDASPFSSSNDTIVISFTSRGEKDLAVHNPPFSPVLLEGFILIPQERLIPLSIDWDYDPLCNKVTFFPTPYNEAFQTIHYSWTLFELDLENTNNRTILHQRNTPGSQFIWNLSPSTPQYFLQIRLQIEDTCCGTSIPIWSDPIIITLPTLSVLNNSLYLGDSQVFCSSETGLYRLGINVPTGDASRLDGSFSGPGVIGSFFNPSEAGSGNHTIEYLVSVGCE